MVRSTRLGYLRKIEGISIRELGKRVGVSPTTLIQYENDTRPISVKCVRKLCIYFRVSPTYLLRFDEDPEFVSAMDNSWRGK